MITSLEQQTFSVPRFAKPQTTTALDAYRAKRRAGATAEPFATDNSRLISPLTPYPRFTIQQHRARHLHFDLRLQFGSTLRSWAVPKGPSMDTADKRFAAWVEDHPLEYGHFEGVIPEGNYGAGRVIVWDTGIWHPLNDPDKGLESGKLLFELSGCKLRGRFTLVRMRDKSAKDSGRQWLFIKERDGLEGPRELPENSVFSGLSIAELEDLPTRLHKVTQQLHALNAPIWHGRRDVKPMLAESADVHDRDDWAYEIKFDGYRIIADKHDEQIHLRSRNGLDLTDAFPEARLALERMPWTDLILDGEVVVQDQSGRPSFSLLQRRISDGVERSPLVRLYCFDLLEFEGRDLRGLPLSERKALLKAILPNAGLVSYVDHIVGNGRLAFESAKRLGLEGVVAKRLTSTYRSGRSDQWVKVRAERSGDFVIIGFAPARGHSNDLGALLLAEYQDQRLAFVGRVGTGFSGQIRTALWQKLLSRETKDNQVEVPALAAKDARWVKPEFVCEVRYREFTHDGHLRHPVFIRERSDKSPADCQGIARSTELPSAPQPRPVERSVVLTNLDKVFWPNKGYKKRDLVDYYKHIAPWLLPYLKDRPLVMTRYPDGVNGKSFFQKDAPVFTPEWIRTEVLWSDGAEREVRYFVAEDETTLVYLANLATIPLHIWSSRVSSLAHPDWCILDLDPKEAPFADVIEVARVSHALCEELGLPSYLKTTGSSGLHILVPLARQLTHDQARTFAELLAREVVRRCEEKATVMRMRAARQKKVYVDYLQNGHGKLLVAPFSVRAVPNANVSMPLPWSTLNARLSNERFDIANAVRHLKAHGDPMLQVLDDRPDLASALTRLAALMPTQ